MKLVVCCTPGEMKQFEEKLQRFDVDIIVSECYKLDDSLPVVMRFPMGEIYGRVTSDRIIEVFKGYAGELKIPTARLYDVVMEKYLSEPVYRKTVREFIIVINHLTEWDDNLISEMVNAFVKTQQLLPELVANAIKMALVKTTKVATVPVLLMAFGREESIRRFKAYLSKYRHRI